jgi:hypothetical protein
MPTLLGLILCRRSRRKMIEMLGAQVGAFMCHCGAMKLENFEGSGVSGPD